MSTCVRKPLAWFKKFDISMIERLILNAYLRFRNEKNPTMRFGVQEESRDSFYWHRFPSYQGKTETTSNGAAGSRHHEENSCTSLYFIRQEEKEIVCPMLQTRQSQRHLLSVQWLWRSCDVCIPMLKSLAQQIMIFERLWSKFRIDSFSNILPFVPNFESDKISYSATL